jgi:hypothetical protein
MHASSHLALAPDKGTGYLDEEGVRGNNNPRRSIGRMAIGRQCHMPHMISLADRLRVENMSSRRLRPAYEVRVVRGCSERPSESPMGVAGKGKSGCQDNGHAGASKLIFIATSLHPNLSTESLYYHSIFSCTKCACAVPWLQCWRCCAMVPMAYY